MAAFTVNSLGDAGTGSNSSGDLLYCINKASANDTIVFDSTLFATSQTITLAGTQLVLSKSVTIDGPGASLLTISGNNASRSFR